MGYGYATLVSSLLGQIPCGLSRAQALQRSFWRSLTSSVGLARLSRASDDLPFLRELADELRNEKPARTAQQPQNVSTYRRIMAEAVDNALDLVGRLGKDVLYTMLEERHGLRLVDAAEKPGQFVSALRDVLGGSGTVIEHYSLTYIQEKTGISARSFEEAAHLLKQKYPR